MVICICRQINEQAVRTAIHAGARSPEDVQAFHGCRFNCGKCRYAMGALIADSVDSEDSAQIDIPAE